MRDYVIITDSSCDLPAKMAEDFGIPVLPLTVIMDDGKVFQNHLDEREVTFRDFYQALRDGKMGKTSAVNVEQFMTEMDVHLKAGKDILYLGFSSGLSATFSSGKIAGEELSPQYPEQKIYAVDTLCASAGQGMIVYLAAMEKQKGKSIEEVRDFVEATKLNISHCVVADDLNHLKRGGRISAATAFVGGALNIKPVINMDDEGKLISVDKIRGRKNIQKKLIAFIAEKNSALEGEVLFLNHADCGDEANAVADAIRAEFPVKDVIVNFIGPVIGAHTGPGAMVLCFKSNGR